MLLWKDKEINFIRKKNCDSLLREIQKFEVENNAKIKN